MALERLDIDVTNAFLTKILSNRKYSLTSTEGEIDFLFAV